jgi:hypothetical protein
MPNMNKVRILFVGEDQESRTELAALVVHALRGEGIGWSVDSKDTANFQKLAVDPMELQLRICKLVNDKDTPLFVELRDMIPPPAAEKEE